MRTVEKASREGETLEQGGGLGEGKGKRSGIYCKDQYNEWYSRIWKENKAPEEKSEEISPFSVLSVCRLPLFWLADHWQRLQVIRAQNRKKLGLLFRKRSFSSKIMRSWTVGLQRVQKRLILVGNEFYPSMSRTKKTKKNKTYSFSSRHPEQAFSSRNC